MLDPYKMIVVNLASSTTLIIGLLFYRFIFPKQKFNLFFLLILILILPVISIFRIGAYESGDFNIHIYRSMSFYSSLNEGNIMPSWAGDLNATYGYPLFIFNYTLPYYIISFFHLLGFSFIMSMKLFLAINVFLSGIFMFQFIKNILKNNAAAFTASIFYVFAPYHLIDVHFKIVIGEILFFTLLPLSFLLMNNLYHKKTFPLLLLSSISLSGLIMSHVALAIFAVILILSYIFFQSARDKFRNKPILNLAALSISMLISVYAWLGPFILSQYSFVQKMKLTTVYFPTLLDILFSPWRFGFLFQGPKGETSYLIGYSHLIVLVIILCFIVKKSVANKFIADIYFWLAAFFISVFLILPYSKALWELTPIIKVTGSHRLLIFTSLTSSALAGYLTLVVKKRWVVYLLILIAIGTTILNWGQRRVIPEITDDVLRKNLWKSTSQGEAHFYANSKWADAKHPWFSKLPKDNIEIVNGKGTIKKIVRLSTKHVYEINAESPLSIEENTLYFPGWTAKIKNKILPIYPNSKGIIIFNAPKGKYKLELIYNDLPIYRIFKLISVASFALALSLFLLYFVKSFFLKRFI